jgi:phosphoenolpyruvate carboxykinase (GTP)
MAMLPFCGYNMADYFEHWLGIGPRLAGPPRIFRVNWFRRDADRRFLWPGYGDNARILKWMVERIRDRGRAIESPIGYLPAADALDLTGSSISEADVARALAVDAADWLPALDDLEGFFAKFGPRLPGSLHESLANTRRRFRAR